MKRGKKARTVKPDNDEKLWRRSPDPVEVWDSDQEWEVGEIVDVYEDPMDPKRASRKYKVSWIDWQREDGSNTTWMSEQECQDSFPNILKVWKAKYSQGKAKLPPLPESHQTSLFHLDLEETLLNIRYVPPTTPAASTSRKRKTPPTRAVDDDEDELDIIDMAAPSPPRATTPPRPSIRMRKSVRAISASTQSSRAVSEELPTQYDSPSPPRPAPPVPSSTSSPYKRPRIPPINTTPARRASIASTSTPSSSRTLVNPASAPSSSHHGKGKGKGKSKVTIMNDWDTGDAAFITVVNEVDDEEGPALPEWFKYLEAKYLRDDETTIDSSFFAACDGSTGRCTNPDACDCQGDSTLKNDVGERIVAYDRQRRYTFPAPGGALVIECNEACECEPDTCVNRVAQRPRDVALQIFKTADANARAAQRGWGVRVTERLQRGQVIGVYTGELIPRAKAHRLKAPQKHYVFDIDFNENDEQDDDMSEKWSVLSYNCGNWSRFLNHSCDPNVRLYPVLFDHPQIPKLAFVAAKDITPFDELVIDYLDAAGVRTASLKRERLKRPKDSTACLCGAGPAKCRRWFPG
ncbi:SET domain-containing protein [Exidia glandulosa HHB12029]|uniref:SET domain-containing protein n=1 Tax=Exidia glandulosa HHB12029 TaxID=1314781 RepID=A0A165GTC2_EXIGL|nr:SET domain-containing protein [Exidia glandulosa HHB12029]